MAHIPNILTLLRLMMVPLFVAVFMIFPEYPAAALIVYAAAMLTDALDGKIARAYNCVSVFGTLADPLADKLMTLAAVVCLAWSNIIPAPAMILVAVREVAMIAVGIYAAKSDIVIPACLPGKLSTVLFTVSLILLFPWHNIGWLFAAARLLLYIAIVSAFYAAAYYLVMLIRRMRRRVQI